MAKTRYIGNIYYDSSGLPSATPGATPPSTPPIRTDITDRQWETAVVKVLDLLYKFPPNRTSMAVIGGIFRAGDSGRDVVIFPNVPPVNPQRPQSRTGAKDEQAATPSGMTQLYPQDDPKTLKVEKPGDPKPGAPLGTGVGSDAGILFTPQDYSPIYAQPAGPPDEALIHELTHALRIMRGDCRPVAVPTRFGMQYDNCEELLAVVIANIYRSESHRVGLRADHHGHQLMLPPFSDPDSFYLTYEQDLDNLCAWMPFLSVHVAKVVCRFNPIRSCVRKRLGIRLDREFSDYDALCARENWW